MLSKSYKDKVLKACSIINGGKKASKSVVYSKSWGGKNNEQGKCKSKISMLEKKVRNKKMQLSVFNTAANHGSYNEESYDSEKEDGNRNYSAFTRQGKSKGSRRHDMGRLNLLIVGSRLIVVLVWQKYVPLK